VTVGVLAALAATFARFLFWNNFDVVERGRVYRSAQPKADLAGLVSTYRLASILNLRGGTEAEPWYRGEVETAGRMGVDFYDLHLSATVRPSRCELLTLIDVFERCRYPLLIHCKSGSDRTGLASALYRLSRLGRPPREALGDFSVFRGHVPLGGPEHLQEPFREYDDWLRARRLAHTPARFRAWVERDYRDERPTSNCPPLRPGPRPRLAAAGSARRR
jgi:protein tyrosine/serine phosphatase